MTGRPSLYSDELAEKICLEIAQGRSLNSLTKEDWCPSYWTLCRWLRDNEVFREIYARSREDLAELGATEINELADEPPQMTPEGKVDAGWVHWQKNRIEARKWVAAKLKARVYGERTHTIVEATVSKAKPVTDEQAMEEIAQLSQQLGMKYVLAKFDDTEEDE
jgi:hypothetical protein